MSGYVIRHRGLAGSVVTGAKAADGDYLVSYDPEAHDGRGEAEWSPEAEDAWVFPTFLAAGNTWRAVPSSRPKRPDGRPNRPLTAVSVEIEPDPLGRDA